jgi:hypothetical protein
MQRRRSRGGPCGRTAHPPHESDGRRHRRVGQIIEWILIFLALLSLWPWILGYRAPWYRGLLIVALAAMVWVAVRRITRVRRAR